MEPLSKLVIVIAAEVLFLMLVITVAWLVITRRQLLKQRQLRIRRDGQLNNLRQRLQQTHQHLHAANEQLKQLQSAAQPQDDLLLRNYQQRISNLEKFKELYFELEDRIAEIGEAGSNKEEVERYKLRAQELENIELRLKNELIKYRRRVQELEASSGTVRIKEVEDLSNRLRQRENELRRLREECETIGLQYEELATKSLAMVGASDDLTDDQKLQLEELKRKLEENSAALARKQAECELLENYYLELEESAELAKTAERMQQSNAERDVLRQQQRELNSQAESAVGHAAAEEMAKLRQALAAKEASLNEIRNDYREIKEQFVEVAQEENDLRQSNHALRQECEELRSQLRELNEAHQGLTAQREELEKLRSEYSKMEARYLALAGKNF